MSNLFSDFHTVPTETSASSGGWGGCDRPQWSPIAVICRVVRDEVYTNHCHFNIWHLTCYALTKSPSTWIRLRLWDDRYTGIELKLIKSRLREGQERLRSLMLMSVEPNILQELDLDNLVQIFADIWHL